MHLTSLEAPVRKEASEGLEFMVSGFRIDVLGKEIIAGKPSAVSRHGTGNSTQTAVRAFKRQTEAVSARN